MTQAEARAVLEKAMRAFQRYRSISKEQGIGETWLSKEMWPWVYGNKCPLPAIAKMLDARRSCRWNSTISCSSWTTSHQRWPTMHRWNISCAISPSNFRRRTLGGWWKGLRSNGRQAGLSRLSFLHLPTPQTPLPSSECPTSEIMVFMLLADEVQCPAVRANTLLYRRYRYIYTE